MTVSSGQVANGTVHLPALVAEHFGKSRSEARRLLEQGGIRLDGEPLGAESIDLEAERLERGRAPGRKASVPAHRGAGLAASRGAPGQVLVREAAILAAALAPSSSRRTARKGSPKGR